MQTQDSNIQIRQELVNSIVHGFGIIFGIVSIPILIAFAIKSDNTSGIIGAAIYGFCFTTFTFSTLYHGISTLRQNALEILDHISIYFLIAGTTVFYLCICLILLV
jgi:hemolysin III